MEPPRAEIRAVRGMTEAVSRSRNCKEWFDFGFPLVSLIPALASLGAQGASRHLGPGMLALC